MGVRGGALSALGIFGLLTLLLQLGFALGTCLLNLLRLLGGDGAFGVQPLLTELGLGLLNDPVLGTMREEGCHGLLDLLFPLALAEQVQTKHHALLAEQVANRVRRLRTLTKPVKDAVLVQADGCGLAQRLVPAEVFYETTIAGAAGIRGNEGIDGELLAAHPAKAKSDCHDVRLLVERLEVGCE